MLSEYCVISTGRCKFGVDLYHVLSVAPNSFQRFTSEEKKNWPASEIIEFRISGLLCTETKAQHVLLKPVMCKRFLVELFSSGPLCHATLRSRERTVPRERSVA